MSDFEELWKFATRHGSIVQMRSELLHVFDLIKGCKSYLEIGTAEGNSLYVLGKALTDDAKIVYVDIAEAHTKEQREEAISKFYPRQVCSVHHDSHNYRSIDVANLRGPYDVVLIDAGHSYEDVVLDAVNYGHLARKFLLFHDIQMPAVRKAFEWYVKKMQFKNVEIFAEKQSPFGYGIIEVGK